MNLNHKALIPAPELLLRFRTALAWNVLGAVFTHGGTFLANVVIARILGRQAFGEFGMIQTTLITITGIAQVATGLAAARYVAEFRAIDKSRTGRILGLCSAATFLTGILATLFLIAGAPWLSEHTLRAPHLSHGLMIAASSILFSVMNGYQLGALAGLEDYRLLAIAGSLHGVLHVGACWAFTWTFGLTGSLAALAVSALIRWYGFNYAVRVSGSRQSIRISYRGLGQERALIFGFALPAALSGLSCLPALWLARAFLVQQPDGYSQMGLFGAASTLKNVVLFVPSLVNPVGMSLLNSHLRPGDERAYRSLFWTNMGLTASSALVASAGLWLGARWLLLMFGRDFIGAYPALAVLLVAAVFESLGLATYQVVQSAGRMWLSFFAIALPRDVLLVILAYFLTPGYGALGLAIASAASLILAAFMTAVVVCSFRVGAGVEPSAGNIFPRA